MEFTEVHVVAKRDSTRDSLIRHRDASRRVTRGDVGSAAAAWCDKRRYGQGLLSALAAGVRSLSDTLLDTRRMPGPPSLRARESSNGVADPQWRRLTLRSSASKATCQAASFSYHTRKKQHLNNHSDHMLFYWNDIWISTGMVRLHLNFYLLSGLKLLEWHHNFHRYTHELFAYGTSIFHRIIPVIKLARRVRI